MERRKSWTNARADDEAIYISVALVPMYVRVCVRVCELVTLSCSCPLRRGSSSSYGGTIPSLLACLYSLLSCWILSTLLHTHTHTHRETNCFEKQAFRSNWNSHAFWHFCFNVSPATNRMSRKTNLRTSTTCLCGQVHTTHTHKDQYLPCICICFSILFPL